MNKAKVYLVNRDFLLGHFPHSRQAALYANAAAKLNKFEAVSDASFTQQPVWIRDGNVDRVAASVLSVEEMGKVRKLLTNASLDSAIKADMAEAQKIQIQRTPTMLISSKMQSQLKFDGGVSYPLLKKILADLL